MGPIRINICDLVFNLKGVNRFNSEVVQGSRVPKSARNFVYKGLERAAKEYVSFLRLRYLRLSNSPKRPQWPRITKRWRKRKGREGHYLGAATMTGTLQRAISYAPRPAGGYDVGYVKDFDHPQATPLYPTVFSVVELLQNKGIKPPKDKEERRWVGGGIRRWQIIVLPDAATRRAMTGHIQKGVDQAINDANRRNKYPR